MVLSVDIYGASEDAGYRRNHCQVGGRDSRKYEVMLLKIGTDSFSERGKFGK